MPLVIRPFQDSDEGPLRTRFAPDARAPWLRLPHPFTIADLVTPEPGLNVFVAEITVERVVGLIAVDARKMEPLLIGPLVPDEQLADLYSHALIGHGLGWARQEGLSRLQARIDLASERGIGFFLNQGFHLLGRRQLVLAAVKASRGTHTPTLIEGVRFGVCPDMLSSDYLRLYQEVGFTERALWTRPQVFEHLQRPGVQVLAARAGDVYMGFAELESRGPREAELVHFGMLPAFRGRGVGSALLEHVLHHAFETMALERVWISLVTGEATDNYAAMLARRGFHPDRTLVFLEKDLTPVPAPNAVGA